MGLVIDKEIAEKTPCHGFKEESGEMILWSPGIIGVLSDPQEKVYCTNIILSKHEVPAGIKKRWSEFREAAKVCSIQVHKYPKGERLIPYLNCMSEEAKKRGIEI